MGSVQREVYYLSKITIQKRCRICEEVIFTNWSLDLKKCYKLKSDQVRYLDIQLKYCNSILQLFYILNEAIRY